MREQLEYKYTTHTRTLMPNEKKNLSIHREWEIRIGVIEKANSSNYLPRSFCFKASRSRICCLGFFFGQFLTTRSLGGVADSLDGAASTGSAPRGRSARGGSGGHGGGHNGLRPSLLLPPLLALPPPPPAPAYRDDLAADAALAAAARAAAQAAAHEAGNETRPGDGDTPTTAPLAALRWDGGLVARVAFVQGAGGGGGGGGVGAASVGPAAHRVATAALVVWRPSSNVLRKFTLPTEVTTQRALQEINKK